MAAGDLGLLLAERMRRGNLSGRILGAVKNRFEFIPRRRWEPTSRAERVRRLDVYEAAAAALQQAAVTNEFCKLVTKVCVEAGAVLIHPSNVHMFAFMREKPDPAEAAKEWEEKLTESGFVDIEKPNGELKRLGGLGHGRSAEAVATSANIHAGRFDHARELYWKLERDLRVMELYAMQGKSVRDIANALDMSKSHVHRTVTRLLNTPGGHGGGSEEHGEDE